MSYFVVGHVTHDKLSNGQYGIGGTVSYAARTAAALVSPVGILTSAGPDFDRKSFNPWADVTWVTATQTTTFKNTYTAEGRQQWLYGLAQPLQFTDVPSHWVDAPLVHIGPVMAECTLDLVTQFAKRAFVGVTPQGWLRTCTPREVDAATPGRVKPTLWETAAHILPLASAVVLSPEDVGGDWDMLHHFAQQTTIMVVTQGYKGGMLFLNGKAQPFTALAVEEVDPTGAGDIFATAFFIALAAHHPPMVAANFAACLAGHSVTRRGLDAIPRASEVNTCSQILKNG